MTLMIISLFQLNLSADTLQNISVVLKKSLPPGHEIPKDEDGRRAPSRPVFCTFYENGQISGISDADIIFYEIRTIEDDFCLAVYHDAKDFSYHLFNIPGEYKICIVTEEWLYVGYLSTF